ncbi:MAG: hypothetical protein JWR80_5085 [Bradyrhizobium sp.]|nr:hypothetical protein [Bradyrhizobium sp.]
MPAILLVAPSAEPLSLVEANAFLRVEHDADDAIIAALIAAARGHVEALTRRALLLQSWRVVLDAWPRDGRLRLRIGPLRALLAARTFDAAGISHVIDVQSFVLDAAANVIASPCWALPAPGRGTAGIEFDIACGFGATPADVPEPLRMLLAHWYDNRGVISPAALPLPIGVAALLAPYRERSL